MTSSSIGYNDFDEISALDALIENFDLFTDDYDMEFCEIPPPNSIIISLNNQTDNSEELTTSTSNNIEVPENETVITVSGKKRKILPSEYSIYKVAKSMIQQNQIPQYIVNPVDQLMKLPWHLFGAFNSGNADSLGHLTDELFHSKCVLRWERPVFSLEKVGSTTMKQFFDACLKTVPDGVIGIRQINHQFSSKSGLDVLKCKLTYTGTVLYEHFIEEFQGFKSPSNTSVEYMDFTKLSSAEIEQLRQTEILLRQQGQKIQVFGKMTVKFFIEPSSRKIVGYDERFRLESFTGVAMDQSILPIAS